MITLRKVRISHLIIIATLVFFSHRANALIITQSFDAVNVGNTDIEIYLDPFNAASGTLTNVYIDFRSSSRIMSDQFGCTVGAPFSCTAAGFASLYFFPGGGTFLTLTTDNFHYFRQGDSTLFSVSHGTPAWWPNNLLSLSSFTEAAPRLVASDWWRCEVNCSGDSDSYRDGTHNVRGSLTYVYVPVPATLALLVIGLLALAITRLKSAFCAAL
jgi:hypothetical protein